MMGVALLLYLHSFNEMKFSSAYKVEELGCLTSWSHPTPNLPASIQHCILTDLQREMSVLPSASAEISLHFGTSVVSVSRSPLWTALDWALDFAYCLLERPLLQSRKGKVRLNLK